MPNKDGAIVAVDDEYLLRVAIPTIVPDHFATETRHLFKVEHWRGA